MKTLPEQIQELEAQMGNLTAEVAALNKANASLNSEREGDIAALSAMTSERNTLRDQLAISRNEVVSAQGERDAAISRAEKAEANTKTADQLAVAIMAKVGQPAPLAADLSGGDKPGVEGTKPAALTGLNRAAAFFAKKRAGN